MKRLIRVNFFLLSLMASTASAGGWGLKVNMTRIDKSIHSLYEVCGIVTGPSQLFSTLRIEIQSDYQKSGSYVYNTTVSRTGHFCTVIMSQLGAVQAVLTQPNEPKPVVSLSTRISSESSSQ